VSDGAGVGVGEEGVPEGGMDPTDVEGVDEITRRPAQLSSVLSVIAGAIALVISLAGGTVPVGLAAIGMPVLGLALLFGYPRAIDFAGLLLLAGTVFAGVNGAAIPFVLIGTVATVLAWEMANFAFSVGFQLGRETRTGRVEVLHATASVGVGVVVSAMGFLIYRSGAEGLPISTVVVLLLGALLLLAVLRL